MQGCDVKWCFTVRGDALCDITHKSSFKQQQKLSSLMMSGHLRIVFYDIPLSENGAYPSALKPDKSNGARQMKASLARCPNILEVEHHRAMELLSHKVTIQYYF